MPGPGWARRAASAALFIIAAMTGSAQAQTYANSLLDHSDVQGQGGWYYGFYDGRPSGATAFTPADFEQLPNFGVWTCGGPCSAPNVWYRLQIPGGYWTQIAADYMHPNGSRLDGNAREEVNWAVRRWVSDVAGPAALDIWAAKLPPDPGNGVILHVFRGSQQIANQLVPAGNATGVNVVLPLCLAEGEVFDLGIDPRSGDHFYDGTQFRATVSGPIVTQPVSTTICAGEPAALSVGLHAALTDLAVQWRRNGLAIAGATSAVLSISGIQENDAGEYDCIVSNACGTVVSQTATLTVHAAPRIQEQPASQVLCAGDRLVLTVRASGTPPPTYLWRKDGVGIEGATAASYVVEATGEQDTATYDVQMANDCGTLVSDAATIIVWPTGTGDTNGDDAVDGADVGGFVEVVLRGQGETSGLASCAADLDADGAATMADTPLFVDRLLLP